MHIAMFTNTYLPLVGGIEQSIATFTADLASQGHSVLVVTPQVRGAPAVEKHVFRMPAVTNAGGTAFSLQYPFAPGLRERLDRFAPDLVHTHQPFLLGDTGLREARRRGLPLVFTHHTFYERYADFFGFESETTARLARRLPVEYANLCDWVIAPTPTIAGIIRRRGVEKPVTVLPTGVDTGFFSHGDGRRFRADHGIPEEATVIGHLGRLVPAKNMSFLAEAVAEALSREPKTWTLWVGEGESVDEIQRIFRARGVAERMVMPGACRGQPVADAYAAMDVFVFASGTDTQGIVLVESLASGTPVIALDTPGPRDIVRNGLDGWLLSPHASPTEFTEAIVAFVRDPERRVGYGKHARKRAKEFERTACAQRLTDLYTEVQAARPPPVNGELDAWNQRLERVATEWDLFREKTSAALGALLGVGPE